MRLPDSVGERWPRALALLSLFLLAVPGQPAAQEFSWRQSLTPADDSSLSLAERVFSKPSCSGFRLLPDKSPDCESWMGSLDFAMGTPLRIAQADTKRPPAGEAGEPNDLPGTPLTPADNLSPAEGVFSEPWCSQYRLLPGESRHCEPAKASADLATGAPLRIAQADAERPPVEEARQPNRLIGRLIPVGAWAGVAANSLLGYSHQKFHTANEGWFGANTEDGGADKTSHFADYYIVSKEMAFLYQKLGYSENEARWWGLGIAVTTGLLNEISDGFTYHGFAWQDFAMDTFGAATATMISLTRTEDLLGVRGSHLPPQQYAHDVYSADLKLSGVGRRLGINIGPLRWLLLSVTYASKGYQNNPSTIALQRQVGFEIGLNLQQILDDLGVKRDTWWGHALHVVGDNLRFPYTAFGLRVDLNRGKWHGPNNGNYP